jgi:hypothetical protein
MLKVSPTAPLLLPVPEALRRVGLGRTRFYELARAGHFDCRKAGRRTLVTTESLDRFAAALPRLHGEADAI